MWLAGSVVVVLLLIQVIVSNRLATSGHDITRIEQEIQTVNEENQLYAEKIASASALMAIADKAKQLGFVTPVNPIFLTRDLPVALNLQ
ncbi:MAG: hypothetical protein UV61_C0002G0239 [Candidatus Gottesmanbacteria bacterium GW2011_GWB1_43_11]|uniref:Cell division protein FtsL n=1 Tax=Candidatus Gottesmanbacteria bacterium GW2011_GWB1_43_11 TaxID=1618446 RepID=A0A0G1FKT2_9BACT|nr:MAG: hypothetical protein UV04_C0001G0127 [Candidatus Gottesmanbacteria bacterium GW2011_GWA2_42_16]KKS56316.1 MAG: hypothetical protein UV17_C0001G0126 [Candidatus Gottesmanbacteria bacterium GW2011_GWA1_42_26]KKS82324.1 MAG: hypothetical protein UV55_C0003G0043 [Candidatus Gottesmanbacteria bacterium GW2011_GWC1_43_10]KKS87518.1 MAG: hypothetical protein UV61_C0002G0239 [Candidatus Gottesmanbacteria bacterium GW2011_GWB1_43_11]OGG10335.1 MAG: hypothetical protein A2699_00810 [Candidatus Go